MKILFLCHQIVYKNVSVGLYMISLNNILSKDHNVTNITFNDKSDFYIDEYIQCKYNIINYFDFIIIGPGCNMGRFKNFDNFIKKNIIIVHLHEARNSIYNKFLKNCHNHIIIFSCEKDLQKYLKKKIINLNKNIVTIFPQIPSYTFIDKQKNIYNIGKKKKKSIDILLIGNASPKVYKLRNRLYDLINQQKIKNSYILKHVGYIPKDSDYYKKYIEHISKSKFVITDSSIFKIPIKKYFEIPLCGSIIIGDIPDNFNGKEDIKSYIVEINEKQTDEKIVEIINKSVENYDEIYKSKYKKSIKIIKNRWCLEYLSKKIIELVDNFKNDKTGFIKLY